MQFLKLSQIIKLSPKKLLPFLFYMTNGYSERSSILPKDTQLVKWDSNLGLSHSQASYHDNEASNDDGGGGKYLLRANSGPSTELAFHEFC